MGIIPINNEVYCTDGPLVTISSGDILSLKDKSHQNPRRRARICAHPGTESNVHEMLIVHEKGIYVRPHKHNGKPESFHIIEGISDIIIFEDDGGITDIISMGDYVSGKIFYYRLSEPRYHSLVIRSDVLVFHEVTAGPFNREDTEFAPWSPEDKGDAGLKYLQDLEISMKTFLAARERTTKGG